MKFESLRCFSGAFVDESRGIAEVQNRRKLEHMTSDVNDIRIDDEEAGLAAGTMQLTSPTTRMVEVKVGMVTAATVIAPSPT